MEKDQQDSDKVLSSLPTEKNAKENQSNIAENSESSHTSNDTSNQVVSKSPKQSEMLKNKFEAEFTQLFSSFASQSKENKNPTSTMASGPTVQQGILEKAMSAFTNMHMAHEICIDADYKLEPPEKVESMESRISDMMKRAFWDLVNEDLEKDPPVHDHAIKVFEEIKENLLKLLLPHNFSIRVLIEETLNVDEIRKEVAHDALDFEKYVNFMVDCLAKICSPLRDAQVEEIRHFHKPSEVFRRLFEVMDVMHLDMANFYLSLSRPKIMEHCVSYERTKFIEFLELEYELTQDGMRNTREWLLRHKMEGRDTPHTIAKAFGELISWNPEHPWPETLSLDESRFAKISQMIKRATIFSAMSFSVIEFCKPLFLKNYAIYNTIRADLDKSFKILLPFEHMRSNEQIIDDTEACAEQSVRIVGQHFQAMEGKELSGDIAAMMRQSVKDVLRVDNKVRSLLMMRIVQYIEECVLSELKQKVPLNPGLSSIQTEVEQTSTEFCRIVLHNRNAYNDIYCDIVEEIGPMPTFGHNVKDPDYSQYLRHLKATHRSNTSMATEHSGGPSQATKKESQPEPATSNVQDGTLKSGTVKSTNIAPSQGGNGVCPPNASNVDPLIVSSSCVTQNGEESQNISLSMTAAPQKNLKHPRTQSISTPPEDELPQASISEVTTEKKLKSSLSMNGNDAASENSKTSVDQSSSSSDTSMDIFNCEEPGTVEKIWSPATIEMIPSRSEHCINQLREAGLFSPPAYPISIHYNPTDPEILLEDNSLEYLDPPTLPILLQENHFAEEADREHSPQITPAPALRIVCQTYPARYIFEAQELTEMLDFEPRRTAERSNRANNIPKPPPSLQNSTGVHDVDDIQGVNCNNNLILQKEETCCTMQKPVEGGETSGPGSNDEVSTKITTGNGVAEDGEAKSSNNPDGQRKEGLLKQKCEMKKVAENTMNHSADKK